MKLLGGLFNRYRGVLGVRDAAMLIYSNMLNNAAYDVMRFVLVILGFDTMNIFGVALVYIFYALSSMARLFSGVVIDIFGREKRVLVISNALIAMLFLIAFLILIIMGINALSLVLVLIVIVIGVSLYTMMGTVRSALVKDLLGNDNEKITLYTSLNNTLRSIISVFSTVVSGYLLFLSIHIAKYLILSSAILSIVALTPLILMRYHGRVTDGFSAQVIRRGFARFGELFRRNIGFRAIILTVTVTYLLIISLDVLSYSILSLYYNVALLAGIDSLFGYAGATIGSILTPRFRVSKLRVVYVILTTALIIGLGFGIIPMLIRSLVVAVPLLFMVNLIYNIFINAFFTAVMSALISVVPRGEFGIVYSSRGYYSRITDCECRYLGLHRLGHWCAKGLNNRHGNGHNGIPRI
ncbi:MFS transporter [Vulcanisaeta sp. JCM 16159]|uniref:MFS transporter n=1 Tax=Vulcanisaeta sp. JCM 16159 TaxID=1295371 RepID=UPI0006D0DBCD|nr:MFS transporter [Vulcanisaeta sp. JCM 16159]